MSEEIYYTILIDSNPEVIIKLQEAFDDAHAYYIKELKPLLSKMENDHPQRNPDRSLKSVKNGDAIQRFMDDIPNYAFGARVAVQANTVQEIGRALIRANAPTDNGFPEDHFAACYAMIKSYPDETVRIEAMEAFKVYEMKLRNPVSYLATKFFDTPKPPRKPATPPVLKAEIDKQKMERCLRIIDATYKQMELVATELHEVYPESKFVDVKDMRTSDAFTRLMDLVPKVQKDLLTPVDTHLMQPLMARADETKEIFTQVKALLQYYKNDKADKLARKPHVAEFTNLLEKTLLEAYAEFDKHHTPAPQNVNAVEAERLNAVSDKDPTKGRQ